MRAVIVYDNIAREPFRSGWGFSCYFMKSKILFDTGADGETLLYNMHLLGIDPDEIEKVVISHDHADHTGGLWALIEKNRDIEIIVPREFSVWRLKNLRYRIITSPTEIKDNYIVTPVDSEMFEQILIVKTVKGLSVFTGCSHPGLDRILEFSRKFGMIYSLIGGFHDFRDVDLLRDVHTVFPCHCTVMKEKILSMKNSSYCEVGREIVIK